MKIIYIEDNEEVQKITIIFIQNIFPNAELITFSDIPNITDMSDIDLIISDCNLPSGNFCEHIKKTPIRKPTVIVSGQILDGIPKHCVPCYKPYSIDQLEIACNSAMQI